MEFCAEMNTAAVSLDLLNACAVKWLSRRTAGGDKKNSGVSACIWQRLQVVICPEPIDVKDGSFGKASRCGVDFATAGRRREAG